MAAAKLRQNHKRRTADELVRQVFPQQAEALRTLSDIELYALLEREKFYYLSDRRQWNRWPAEASE